MKDIDLDVHIKVLERGENFVQDNPNCTFEELEQVFCKHLRIVNNNKEIYM
jgi:hypothetical protein